MEAYIRYCPQCGEEYRPHIVRCVECGGALKDRLADDEWRVPRQTEQPAVEEEALPPGDYKKVAVVHPSTAGLLMEQFNNAGIPIRVEADHHGLRLSARREDMPAAMTILEQQEVLPRQPDPGERAVAAEGGPCPACGAEVEAKSSECPGCSLVLTGSWVCERCGREVASSAEVCPACGQPPS